MIWTESKCEDENTVTDTVTSPCFLQGSRNNKTHLAPPSVSAAVRMDMFYNVKQNHVTP